MATYKITYTLGDKKWIHYAEEVTNENEAVMVTDGENPEIPREAEVNVEFVCE